MRKGQLALGGLLGGLTLFVWSFLSHMPPVGTMGYGIVSGDQDAPVLAALGGAMDRRAIYVLPRIDMHATPEAQRDWTARYEAGPSAVVLFDPHPGRRAVAGSAFTAQIITELVTAILSATLGAAIALGLSSALNYWPRVLLLTAIGVIATIDVDASYWSWYGIPTAFLFGQLVDHVGGWLLAGLVLARVCPPR
jgi:hypothetical protein